MHILCIFVHVSGHFRGQDDDQIGHLRSEDDDHFGQQSGECIFWYFIAYVDCYCIFYNKLHIVAYLYIFPYFTIQVSVFNFLQSYILDDQDIAQEFTYHHRLPSASPGFESQDPPSKSAASPRMLKGMVPVSPTGTNGSLDKMDVMGKTYSTCLLLLRS